jgi:hypothetical protein
MTDYINASPEDKIANYNEFNNQFMNYTPIDRQDYVSEGNPNSLNTDFKVPDINSFVSGVGMPLPTQQMGSTMKDDDNGYTNFQDESLIKHEDRAPAPVRRLAIPKNKITDAIDALPVSDSDKQYLKVLGTRESGLDPNAVATAKGNTYRGIYQFGNGALSQIGMKPDDYDNNINSQFSAALKFGRMNIQPYRSLIGSTVDGVKITENGLMAAAHLGGAGGLKALLNGQVRKDKFGTSTLDYMKLFDQ